jgi:hypothetical protein
MEKSSWGRANIMLRSTTAPVATARFKIQAMTGLQMCSGSTTTGSNPPADQSTMILSPTRLDLFVNSARLMANSARLPYFETQDNPGDRDLRVAATSCFCWGSVWIPSVKPIQAESNAYCWIFPAASSNSKLKKYLSTQWKNHDCN